MHGLNPGIAVDLRTGWNLDTEEGVRGLWRHLRLVKPLVVLGSPECKGFSTLQGLNRGTEGYRRALAAGIRHLRLCCEIYEYQIREGRYFIHEHPWSASSWGQPMVLELLRKPGVQRVRVDQCMYGLMAESHGVRGLAQKPTGFATNSSRIARAIARRCNGQHAHVQLIGGIASKAAAYPDRLVDAILRGIRAELQDAGRLQKMDVGGPTMEEPELEVPYPTADFDHDGAGRDAPPAARTVEGPGRRYWDEYTGQPLDPDLVRQAREAEIEYMHRLKVYVEATREECERDGCTPIPMRWIDSNKGDDTEVQIRSRAVLQETKRRSNLGPNDIAATFAATPPLEGLRLSFSMAMTGDVRTSAKNRRVFGVL